MICTIPADRRGRHTQSCCKMGPNTALTAPACPARPLLEQLRPAPGKRAELPRSAGWWHCEGQHRCLLRPRDKSYLGPTQAFWLRWSNSKLDANSPEFHPDCSVSVSDDILPRVLVQAKHVRGRDKFPKCTRREWLATGCKQAGSTGVGAPTGTEEWWTQQKPWQLATFPVLQNV